jgi:transcriptional regulator with XRE-family HTH domain
LSDDLMTFGEFLRNIMKDKNISVTKLTELTGIKSRNSIQRILKNEVSICAIQAFKERLLKVTSLDLSPYELQQLGQAIEVTKIGKDAFHARKILSQLFDSPSCRINSENLTVRNPVHGKNILLRELFASYQSFSKIRFLIFNMISLEFTNELIHLMKNSPPGFISVSQILYVGDNPSHNAAAFTVFFSLFNFENYQVYSISDGDVPENQLSIIPNSVVVDKETLGTAHFTDLITLDADNRFSFIADLPDHTLYSFHSYHFEKMKIKAKSMKRTPSQSNPIDRVISICDACLPLEKSSAKYIVKHSVSTTMIPFSILNDMVIEMNYFGRSKDDPQIRKMLEIFNERFYTMYHTKASKVNLVTKRGLLDFVTSGLMSDHFCYLRPFTKKEIKIILEFIIEQLENNSYFKILLLKNDYAIGNIEFTYFEDRLLWVSDTCSGYRNDYYEGVLDSAPILRIFDDFIKNELIQNHTLPEAESIEFLKHLISIV